MTDQPLGPRAVPSVCYRHTERETHIRCQRCERSICPECMRPAAVGFQCPSCVKEGAKTTRSGRTAYGGQRSSNPALTSQVLVGINVAVWVAILATGWRDSWLVTWLAQHSLGICDSAEAGRWYPGVRSSADCGIVDGTWVPGVADGAWWQLVSSMFTHVQPWHLGLNMLMLWFVGPHLEAALGRTRFLALWFLSGLGGSALVYVATPELTRTLGASGAGFGMLAALLVLTVKVRGDTRELLTWVGLNVVLTLLVPNISWQGHLGGFVGGLLLTGILVYAPRQHRTAWQVAGVAAYSLLLVAILVVRTLALT